MDRPYRVDSDEHSRPVGSTLEQEGLPCLSPDPNPGRRPGVVARARPAPRRSRTDRRRCRASSGPSRPTRCSTCLARGSSPHGAGVSSRSSTPGMQLDHPDLAPNVVDELRRGARQRRRRRRQRLRRRRPRRRPDHTRRRTRTCTTATATARTWPGTIAAAANGRGVVGVASAGEADDGQGARRPGRGQTGAVAEGIRYAAANGARIINLSLEGHDRRPAHARRGRGRGGRQRADRAARPATAASTSIAARSIPVSIAAANVVGVAATEPGAGRQLPRLLQLRPAHGARRRARRGR